MDEGPRLVGAWRGASNDALRLDLPVRATLENESESFALIYFSPDAEASA
jgi:hypothetical protein